MHYDYVPITHRRPLKWPGGKRVALIMTINLETWDLTKDTDKPYYAGGPAIQFFGALCSAIESSTAQNCIVAW